MKQNNEQLVKEMDELVKRLNSPEWMAAMQLEPLPFIRFCEVRMDEVRARNADFERLRLVMKQLKIPSFRKLGNTCNSHTGEMLESLMSWLNVNRSKLV